MSASSSKIKMSSDTAATKLEQVNTQLEEEIKMSDRKSDSVDLVVSIEFHRLILHLNVILISIQFLH